MSTKKHQKPTQPFGYIAFTKTGKVRKEAFMLPGNKSQQEKEITTSFIKAMNKAYETSLRYVGKLKEDDHDSLIANSTNEIELQITELVNYEYAIPYVDGFLVDKPNFNKIALLKKENVPYLVDESKYECALRKIIEKKVKHKYSKNVKRKLWLLIYSLSNYDVVFWSKGEKRESNGYLLAKEYLCSEKHNFDQVWFYFPFLDPVQIY